MMNVTVYCDSCELESQKPQVLCLACVSRQREKAEKLQAFKDYVHKRLDDAGVPVDPNPARTGETGCRIGNRLDWIVDRASWAKPLPEGWPFSEIKNQGETEKTT